MRAIRTSVLTFGIFAAAFTASAQTALIGQSDVALQGGVYNALNTENPAACAQLCAQDSICMAWTFRAARDGACELKAVIPHAVAETGAISGLSSRAPDFARQLAEAASPAKPTLVASTETHAVAASTDAQAEVETQAGPTELLGGPPEDELRPQLDDQTARH